MVGLSIFYDLVFFQIIDIFQEDNYHKVKHGSARRRISAPRKERRIIRISCYKRKNLFYSVADSTQFELWCMKLIISSKYRVTKIEFFFNPHTTIWRILIFKFKYMVTFERLFLEKIQNWWVFGLFFFSFPFFLLFFFIIQLQSRIKISKMLLK